MDRRKQKIISKLIKSTYVCNIWTHSVLIPLSIILHIGMQTEELRSGSGLGFDLFGWHGQCGGHFGIGGQGGQGGISSSGSIRNDIKESASEDFGWFLLSSWANVVCSCVCSFSSSCVLNEFWSAGRCDDELLDLFVKCFGVSADDLIVGWFGGFFPSYIKFSK